MYAVDSAGNITETDNNIGLGDVEVRFDDLQDFAERLTVFQRRYDPELTSDCFDYLIAGNNPEERLLYITKESIPSDSDEVKRSQKATWLEDSEKYRLSSIYEDKSNDRHEWWILRVGMISRERNLYDNRIIGIECILPVYYKEFIEQASSMAISEEESQSPISDKFMFLCPSERNYYDIPSLIESAIEHDRVKEIQRFINVQRERLKNVDRHSNQKQLCLQALSGGRVRPKDMYEPYMAVKQCLKKRFGYEAIGVSYRNSIIRFRLESKGEQYQIYAYKQGEATMFNIGGRMMSSVERLTEFLTTSDPKTFSEQWFNDMKATLQAELNKKNITRDSRD